MSSAVDFRLTVLTAVLVALALTVINVNSLADIIHQHHRISGAIEVQEIS
jgi:hypothetical protein